MFGDLEVHVESSSDGATVVVVGEVDRATSDQLRNEIDAAFRRDAASTIDLDGVTYLDSSAIAVLFDAVRVHGADVVASRQCLVRSALEITGLPLRAPEARA